MPNLRVNTTSLYYETFGEGAETLFFSHGLLWSGEMFHKQVDYFKKKYRCVCYDHRGQGKSEKTNGDLDIDTLTQDAIEMIEQLGIAPCHFVGLSMGGFVGMRIAARRPELLKSLILLETSADAEPNKLKYTLMSYILKWLGIKVISGQVMKIMFGKTFLNDSERERERELWERKLEKHDSTIIPAVMGVVHRKSVYDEIKNITLPTLIIVGDEDIGTVPEKAKRIHTQIPGSELIMIKGAGHTSCVEEPEQVNDAVDKFLTSVITTKPPIATPNLS